MHGAFKKLILQIITASKYLRVFAARGIQFHIHPGPGTCRFYTRNQFLMSALLRPRRGSTLLGMSKLAD